MSLATVVITGATGKTGRRLVERLAARTNIKVRRAVRSVTGKKPIAFEQFAKDAANQLR